MKNSVYLPPSEEKLAHILWENEPMKVIDIVRIARECWDWKRTTTTTLLKRLEEKGIVKNENAMLSSKIGKDEFYTSQSREFVNDVYGGSLPQFVASFIGKKKLSAAQVAELKELIERHQDESRVW
ncbi:MAG: BlaI/MecI/CopY family transcriptional regulator [Lachnospiraceae bacterium]|jgi:predicted transcriptional regulator|nr:BlaI/MecI/CopY family transcriptional regulator [Lachnospiraceae bacterium]